MIDISVPFICEIAVTSKCNLNCVYCQFNWTKIKPKDLTILSNFIEINSILSAVEKTLFALSPPLLYNFNVKSKSSFGLISVAEADEITNLGGLGLMFNDKYAIVD